MNKCNENGLFTFLQGCGKSIKTTAISCGLRVGIALIGIVAIVALPIIGPAGSIGCLFAAAYHGVLTNYHWWHSREKDQNGNLIPKTELNQLKKEHPKNYRDKNAKFESGDLVRLQNEVKRRYHAKALIDSLKWARGLAKCVIPIAGPIWAVRSEMKKGGVSEINSQHDDDQAPAIRPEQMLKCHIDKLEAKQKDV